MKEDIYDDDPIFENDESGDQSFEDESNEEGTTDEFEWNENELNDMENIEWMEDFEDNEAFNDYSEEPNFDELDE